MRTTTASGVLQGPGSDGRGRRVFSGSPFRGRGGLGDDCRDRLRPVPLGAADDLVAAVGVRTGRGPRPAGGQRGHIRVPGREAERPRPPCDAVADGAAPRAGRPPVATGLRTHTHARRATATARWCRRGCPAVRGPDPPASPAPWGRSPVTWPMQPSSARAAGPPAVPVCHRPFSAPVRPGDGRGDRRPARRDRSARSAAMAPAAAAVGGHATCTRDANFNGRGDVRNVNLRKVPGTS